jgi:hypothetical protein
MKFTSILTITIAFFTTQAAYSQVKCGTMEVFERLKKENPNFERELKKIEDHSKNFNLQKSTTGGVITIPVVVHIVLTNSNSVTDLQVQSQIDVLNKDFRKNNAQISSIPSEFSSLNSDVELEFCLAKYTPSGSATNGITRKNSNKSSWGTNDDVKKNNKGGVDAWDSERYLNIWVCTIGGGVLGYAQFPGGNRNTDGVVITHTAFGTVGTATSPFHLGRTATHEVGHWLNLRHIWGDANCGTDNVSDTPTHNTSNTGCPTYPHKSTCSGKPNEMTMNYMDYTDDNCMFMFTTGQKDRMRPLFGIGGFREKLAYSTACVSNPSNNWQVSYNAVSAWNAFASSGYKIPNLALGRFDNDNKDDVFVTNGTQWLYASSTNNYNWVTFASSGYKIPNLALGRFDSDNKDDIFVTNGTQWLYASSANNYNWVTFASSAVTINQIKLADFDGDGKADIFYPTGTEWRVAKSSNNYNWHTIAASGVTLNQLALGDFDGDGKADIFYPTGTEWRVAKSSDNYNWHTIAASGYKLNSLVIGKFDADNKADILLTTGTEWKVAKSSDNYNWSFSATSGYKIPDIILGDFNGDGISDVFRSN